MQKRVKASHGVLYSLLNLCKKAHLVSWNLSKFLFKISVLLVILYEITSKCGALVIKREVESLWREFKRYFLKKN